MDDSLIVELKTVERVLAVHRAQLLSYLRLSGHPVGLILNFHVPHLTDAITRLLNDRARVARGPGSPDPP